MAWIMGVLGFPTAHLWDWCPSLFAPGPPRLRRRGGPGASAAPGSMRVKPPPDPHSPCPAHHFLPYQIRIQVYRPHEPRLILTRIKSCPASALWTGPAQAASGKCTRLSEDHPAHIELSVDADLQSFPHKKARSLPRTCFSLLALTMGRMILCVTYERAVTHIRCGTPQFCQPPIAT